MTDDISPNLGLPFYQTKQNEFEVQHNEALLMLDALVMLAVKDRDLSAPPSSPALGDRYLVKTAGTGDFAGMDNRIAQYDTGGWNFYAPQPGWTCYVQDEQMLVAWDGASWESALDVLGGMAELQNVSLLGIGTTADTTNPLSAKLNNALWAAKTVADGGDGDLRYKLSKESAAKTLSLLFQDNFSGRAEIGLTGDDDFHFKVSADGSTWFDAVTIDRATGKLAFGQGFSDPVAIRGKLAAAPFDALAFNNAVINGSVEVSQELGPTGANLASGTAKYIADMIQGKYVHAAGTAVVTGAQLAAASFPAALPGFAFGHQIKAITAITSPANGDYAKHRIVIEGYRIARWGWGAADAQAIVAAFQFYSTASGTAFVKLSNSDQSRCYYHEITVAAGWNFYAFTVAGDTSGTWQATTSAGLVFEVFVSGKETTPTASLDAWGSTNKVQTTNSGNLLGTDNNKTILTGVYIAAGTQLPVAADLPRLMRPFDVEHMLCQRYYEKSYDYGDAVGAITQNGCWQFFVDGLTSGVRSAVCFIPFKVPKRTAPTMTGYSPDTGTSGKFRDRAASADVNASFLRIGNKTNDISFVASGTSDVINATAHWVADARL